MKSNPWAFAIAFLFLAGYLMWSNFALPVFYPFEETKNVKGYVCQTELVIELNTGFQLK